MLARHPRFTLAVGFLILCTFLLLASNDAIPSRPNSFTYSNPSALAPGLKERLEHSEAVYQDILAQRKGLIEKYGPTPDRIEMFPPAIAPWPAYTAWDYFPAAFNCPHEVERLGALGDGGKWVCGISRLATKPNCIIYSFGINYESSFEAALLSRTSGCEVWGYDFSVTSFGPEILPTQAYRTHFFEYGLAGSEYEDEKKHKMYTLQSLMAQNGHTFIDILKIDVESYEFDALTAIVNEYKARGQPLPFGQLQLEIHAWNKRFSDFLQWWESLEEAGLRPFWTEANLVYQNYNRGTSADLAEYSFINILADHELVSDRVTG